MLDYVLKELAARKGTYPQISKEMQPENWRGYYSWLTKLVRGEFPDPGIHRIEALAERFRRENETKGADAQREAAA